MAIIETEQSREVRLTQIVRGSFVFRYASYRKSEDAKLGLKSEDYIVSEITRPQVLFVLCDGVGSSFYGNIGSQFLGETIFQWMKTINIPETLKAKGSSSVSLKLLAQNLYQELNSKTQLATEIISKKEFPESDLTGLAQKMQRDDFGTQSNFACGLVYPRSHELPHGLIILFWLGNARIRIFNKDQDVTSALHWGENPDQLKEVWSSKDGVVGQINSHLTDFANISTIIAYSDGLEGVEEHITPGMSGLNLETLANKAQLQKDDDISFLELFIQEDDLGEDTSDIANTIRNQFSSSSVSKYEEINKKILAFKKENKALRENLRLNNIFLLSLLFFLLPVLAIGILTGVFIQRRIVGPLDISPTNQPTFASSTVSPPLTATLFITPNYIQPSQTFLATQVVPTSSMVFDSIPTPSLTVVPVIDTPTTIIQPVTSTVTLTLIPVSTPTATTIQSIP
jgi:hypothetical protein